MKKILVTILVLFCASTMFAQPAGCPTATESERLEALLRNAPFRAYASSEFGADLTKPSSVIAYDHIYDKWTVYSWNGKTLTLFKGDAAPSGDTLKVELPPDTTAVMFVTRSNPFFYRSVAKSITVADSDDVAQLKTFASLAGGFLKSFVKVAGENSNRAAKRAVTVDTAQELQRDAIEIDAAAGELERAMKALLAEATTVADRHGQAIAYAQMIELRQEPAGSLPDIALMKASAANLSTAGAGVRNAVARLKKALEPYCPDLATDATAALAILDNAEVKKAESDVKAAEKAVARAKPADRPAKEEELKHKKEDLEDAIDTAKFKVAMMTAASLKCPDSKSHILWNEALILLDSNVDEAKKAFQNIADVVGGGYAAIKLAGDALAKEPGAMKIASWLADTATVAEAYGLEAATPACNYIDSPVLVRSGAFTAKTGKKLSGGFTISKTVDPAVATLKHPEPIERKVEVSSTSKWGLGVGVVYTPLELKSWTVDATTKVVSKATEEAISGQTALFVNFHPSRAQYRKATFGAQLGFNTSTDKPAIYGGVSMDLGKWLRLGTGYSFHRSKRLGDGLQELAVVPADTTFHTEDYYPGAWYASLSLSIDGIPLFQ